MVCLLLGETNAGNYLARELGWWCKKLPKEQFPQRDHYHDQSSHGRLQRNIQQLRQRRLALLERTEEDLADTVSHERDRFERRNHGNQKSNPESVAAETWTDPVPQRRRNSTEVWWKQRGLCWQSELKSSICALTLPRRSAKTFQCRSEVEVVYTGKYIYSISF